MNPLEHFPDEKATAERLTARFATLWAEQRRLVEERIALESSTAWVWLRRLVRWRQRLAPEGSWRHRALCLLRHGWRLGPGKKVEELTRRIREQGCASAPNEKKTPWVADATLRATTGQSRSPTLTIQSRSLTPGAAKANKLRIAYIGSQLALDAATMRYRAHNLIEALPLVGLEGIFVPQEDVPSQLSAILDHDLIVLVRRIRDDALTTLIGLARRKRLPIVYDIDDYIFDPWVMPYVEAFQDPLGRAKVLGLMDDLGACLDRCDYFTGSTSYLAEKAAALGKKSFVIHNGLNSTQLILSQSAREQRGGRQHDPWTRIGYFSGTRTHQADFRVVYPALMRLLHEERHVRLVIVGHLDVGAFPGLAPFRDQIDLFPTCHWKELPAVIAGVDINLIPLELTPFNEGKSNLKYYEAGLVEVPSVASPTRIFCESITHGHNGLLARTPEEWYDALHELIARPDWRRQMGRNALEHVLQNYTPEAIGTEAAAVYRHILDFHHSRC